MKAPHFIPRPRLPLSFAIAFLAVLLGLIGCESTPSASAPLLTVQASRSPAMGSAEDASRHTFRFRYVNARTQELVVPRQGALLDALARRGFDPASRNENPDTIVWIAAIENFRQEVKGGSMVGPSANGNPDSLRYKNAGALLGRYRTLGNDDRNRGGEMMIGPDGEVIMTGNLASLIGEDSTDRPELPSRTVLRLRNVLALWATATTPPQDAADDGELWRVEVLSDLPADDPPPDFDTLVSTAAQHIAQQTDGQREIPAPQSP